MIRAGIFCADYHSPYKPYFRRQARAFERMEPIVFSWEPGPKEVDGIKVVTIDSQWSGDGRRSLLRRGAARLGWATSLGSAAETKMIEALLREHEIDVVIAQTGFTADRIAAAARHAGVPYLAYLRGADLREAMIVKGWGRRLAKVCRQSAHTLVVGTYMAGQLVELGVPLSNILVEPTGAPVFGRTPAEGPGEDNHFLFVGRLVPCKAVETIIDAVRVANEGGGSVRLSIVGDGSLRGALEQQVQDAAQSHAITFLGAQPTEEVDRLLDLVGGLVIHTVDEPGGPEAFGVVVTEAMAARRPVITSRCGGLTDQITDGEQGIVVDQRDVEALASALRRLGEDPELRMRMGRAARLRAEERFDATLLARELEAVAIKVAGERAS